MNWNEVITKLLGSNKHNAEFDKLSDWMKEEQLLREDLLEMNKIWEDSSYLPNHIDVDTETALQVSLARLENTKSNYNWIKWAIAALLCLLTTWAIWTFLNEKSVNQIQYVAEAEITTINKEDGSLVKLWEGSSLSYKKNENQYTLTGNAEFSIEKQKVKPLRIIHNYGIIEVVGTDFFVESKTSSTKIDLYEGTLKLFNSKGESKILNEGSVAIINNNQINIQEYKKGANLSIAFKDSNLSEVMNRLSDLYDISIVAVDDTQDILHHGITANFTNQKLSDILQELSIITGIKLTVE